MAATETTSADQPAGSITVRELVVVVVSTVYNLTISQEHNGALTHWLTPVSLLCLSTVSPVFTLSSFSVNKTGQIISHKS